MTEQPLGEESAKQLLLTGCTVDLEVGQVQWDDGRVIRLTTREVALLRYLSGQLGVDVSSEELHSMVWGHGQRTISRAAADTVRRLRPKSPHPPCRPESRNRYHWPPEFAVRAGVRVPPYASRKPVYTPPHRPTLRPGTTAAAPGAPNTIHPSEAGMAIATAPGLRRQVPA